MVAETLFCGFQVSRPTIPLDKGNDRDLMGSAHVWKRVAGTEAESFR